MLRDLLSTVPRQQVARRMARWQLEPIERRLARAGEQASALAKRLDKGDIHIEVDGGDCYLQAEHWQSFWGAFVHVVRNAVDHGLEPPTEREENGKPPQGRLSLRASQGPKRFTIEIEDDGRGINWPKVQAKAQAKGLPHSSQADLLAALFADGVSTTNQVSDVSGRGVGMGALKAAIEDLGGDIQVHSQPQRGTRWQFHFPLSAMAEDVITRLGNTYAA